MTRLFLLTMTLLTGAGCTFASYARRSNTYPDAYDRALAQAEQAGAPNLREQIQRLGESRSYNSGTHDLFWCLDGFSDGLRWKRQFEKRDLFDKSTLRAQVEQKYGKSASGSTPGSSPISLTSTSRRRNGTTACRSA